MSDAGSAAAATLGKLAPIPDGIVVEDGTELAGNAAKMLESEKEQLGLPDLKTLSLETFLTNAEKPESKMSRTDKETILSETTMMIGNLYPHLPFKKELYVFAHPLETLQEIRGNLDTLSETGFHSWVIIAMNFVVDAHTVYGLPAPYRDAVAFLPFQMRLYFDQDAFPRFVITKVMKAQADGGFGHPFFVPGAEITHWNGNNADFYVTNSRGRFPGGNERARLARGTVFAPVRPLTFCQPPEQMIDTLHYVSPGSTQMRAIKFPWLVATGLEAMTRIPGSAFSMSAITSAVSTANKAFHHREAIYEQRKIEAAFRLSPNILSSAPSSSQPGTAPDLTRVSKLPNVFEFQYTHGVPGATALDPATLLDDGRPEAKAGYIRIRSFEGGPGGTNEIVSEFRRILEIMNEQAPDALILDIRGNPGGDLQAAESMLQMLTAKAITPIQFHLANTPAVIQILRFLRDETPNRSSLTDEQKVQLDAGLLELKPWIDDVEISAVSGELLTTGHPLTPPEQANKIGQVYRGSCVLLTDALTYSAADIFAAGFQDNEIGRVIGVDTHTGGGGANVWTHDDLLLTFGSGPNGPVQKLPPGANLTLAFRRCVRVGKNSGLALEDLGVIPDLYYSPTSPDDVLSGFTRVIRSACKILAASKSFEIRVLRFALQDGKLIVDLETVNIESLVFRLDGSKVLTSDVQSASPQSFVLPVTPATVAMQIESVLLGDSQPVHAADPRHPDRLPILTIEGYALLPGANGLESILATNAAWGVVP